MFEALGPDIEYRISLCDKRGMICVNGVVTKLKGGIWL